MLKYKLIFIGGINRSGGSLLARLFDGHPDIASYPLEIGFPVDNDFYPIFESYTGIPFTVPNFVSAEDESVFQRVCFPEKKPEVGLKWGKEKSDSVGVRKNYLEKVFYGNVETDFDFDKFLKLFHEFKKTANSIAELYDAKHRAYFLAWDKGKYGKNKKYIVMHASSGLYLTNIDKFFKEFKDSAFIYPLRDVMGYIASEKTRLARRYYGARRFSYPKFPNILVKTFRNYDLDAQIRAWMVAVTRVVLLQEKFGLNERFIVYGNENLLNDTEGTMRILCDKIGVDFHPALLQPTIANQPWQGNSHQGSRTGVSKELALYYPKVLASDEISLIQESTAPIREYIQQHKETPLDLIKLPKKHLYDYKFQKRYFDDEEKSALYYALVNSSRRRVMIKPFGFTAVLAYFYAFMVRLIHLPRMVKLKLSLGAGKQNYT